MSCPLLLLMELVTCTQVTGGVKLVVHHKVQLFPQAGQLTVKVPLLPLAAIPRDGEGNTALTAADAGPVPQLPTAAIL